MTREPVEPRGGALTDCLMFLCRYHGTPMSRESLIAGLPLEQGRLAPPEFDRAARRGGLSSRIVAGKARSVNPALLPAILLREDDSACVITAIDRKAGVAAVIYPELNDAEVEVALDTLETESAGWLIYVLPRFHFDERAGGLSPRADQHWFWGVIRENRGLYRDVLVAAVMINLFAVAMPLFIMNVYDRVVPNAATDTLWVLGAGVFLAISADLALRVTRSRFVDLAASRADVKLSSSIMERVLGMRMANRPTSTGSFANTVHAFESVRGFIGSMSVVALVDLPFVLLFAGIVALIGWQLVVPIVIGALLVLLYALGAQRRLQRLSEDAMRAGAMRNATLVEGLTDIETVKAFGVESRIQADWERTSVFLAQNAARMRLISASVVSGAQWAQHAVGIAIIVVGVYLIMEGNLSLGGMIAAYLLSSRAMAPIGQAAGLVMQYHQSAAALDALDEVMEQPVERPPGKSWISRPGLTGEIEFRHVSFSYPQTGGVVLDDVSFRIRAGEHVAVLGRNGSGKSTIEKLILGLYEPDAGAVLVDGVDARQIDPAELRRAIGYVPQDISLFHGSLQENLTLGAADVDDARILEVAKLSGLAPMINRHPEGFDMPMGERGQFVSGGQRQSIAIARALLHDPPMLVLDEPTGALDHSTEALIKRNLQQVAKHKTLLVNTHRSSMLELVDRILVIDAGRLVADGPKDEVIEALRQGRISGAER
ncbi:type I secretion system permease/ATPase [Guyparkeria sp. SB14A]|uniref:type I secretion system permease/ATPase n=1 Tax=Guyparkeria sp. SB14A TaxID=2571147 RepID=UPI0010AC1A88|nr:type I secretion system permease/ATPase [Guyparkeria sp. SB14A]TKA91769.1 type I secretion system permease/ATPase [Guyparkeria sp. SB14A]